MLSIIVYYVIQAIANQCPVGDIFCDVCSGSDKYPIADVTFPNYFCSVSYKNIVADGWRTFSSVATNQHIWVNRAVFSNLGSSVNDERSVMRKMQSRSGLKLIIEQNAIAAA